MPMFTVQFRAVLVGSFQVEADSAEEAESLANDEGVSNQAMAGASVDDCEIVSVAESEDSDSDSVPGDGGDTK